ncbi:MAG: zinc ribbon domain-containing protein [Acidobacteriia bacterium]|nr:zinc ribbon domain-containing protein [Terriglobia bacterium]
MPLYEYRCEKCGKVFEVIQKFADAPLETHQDCGGHVERLLSTPALQFKGTGWYITDYAKGSSSSPNRKSEESKSNESKSSESKTETKPETKSGTPAAKSE